MATVKTLAIDCRMARMSGIGVYIRNLVPRCMALMTDLTPDVRFRLLGHDGAFDIPQNLAWEVVPYDAKIYSLKEQYRVLPLLKGCDALWVPHYPIPLLSRLPLVVTVHDVAHLALRDLYTGLKRGYAAFMFRAVRELAAEILFVSDFSRQEFLTRVGKARGTTTVVHNGLDGGWLRNPMRERAEPQYFLAVGNIKPHKNVRFLCQAFARIAGQCKARLLFVGESQGFRTGEDCAGLESLCPGRIEFTGHISQDRLMELMAGAVALVFPSRYEGFGLPPLEALASGTPVIASDMAVTREVCGDRARYFFPDSQDQLAALLLEALDITPEIRRAEGEQGRRHAGRFTWDRAAEATVPALRRALAFLLQ